MGRDERKTSRRLFRLCAALFTLMIAFSMLSVDAYAAVKTPAKGKKVHRIVGDSMLY